VDWTTQLRKNSCENYVITSLWAFRSFTNYLKSKGINVWNFENLKIPKKKRPDYINFLENEDIKKILKEINLQDVHGLRLRTFIEVMLNTGMRPSEVLKLNRDDPDKRLIEIIGKGRKKRMIYFNNRVLKWVKKYLKERTDEDSALFVTHCQEHRLKLRTIEDDFHHFLQKNFPDKKITLYICRHSYATNLLQHGCPLPYIQYLLGHSKSETTQTYYLSVARKDAIKAQDQYLNYEK
jgi:site-specific recombinase XerD